MPIEKERGYASNRFVFPSRQQRHDAVRLADADTTSLLIDVNIRCAADDPDDDTRDVAADLRSRLERDAKGRPYVDAFLLSHPDKDHCTGLTEHFYLGKPDAYPDDDKPDDKKKIFIRQIWSSPLIFRRASKEHTLCDDAAAFNTEAKRRVQVNRDKRFQGVADGDRILILGEDENGKTDDLTSILIKTGETFKGVNGGALDYLETRLLAPRLQESEDEEKLLSKNHSSVVVNLKIAMSAAQPDGCKFLTGGDAEVAIWERLWARYKDDVDVLSYDMLQTPASLLVASLSYDSWSELREKASVAGRAFGTFANARCCGHCRKQPTDSRRRQRSAVHPCPQARIRKHCRYGRWDVLLHGRVSKYSLTRTVGIRNHRARPLKARASRSYYFHWLLESAASRVSSVTELPWGTPVEPMDRTVLGGKYVQALFAACAEHPDFTLIGLRRLTLQNGATTDYLVVDARSGAPGRNPTGIRPVERIALGEQPGWLLPLDVRALRVDFPDVMHLNGVNANEPKSLCLYDEGWPTVERTWTAYRHLARILWWLKQTALGTLHAPDQALEPLFYASPVRVILPRAVKDAAPNTRLNLTLQELPHHSPQFQIWRGTIAEQVSVRTVGATADGLMLDLPPTISTHIRHSPENLSALDEDFVAMRSDLFGPLRQAIRSLADKVGLERLDAGSGRSTLVVVRIPRLLDGVVDSLDVRAFQIGCELGSLGVACGALFFDRKKWRLFADIALTPEVESEHEVTARTECRKITVVPVEVVFELGAETARIYSGVDRATADFQGMLIGVGALGALLADIWAREGWGRWDYVDEDVLLPHNVVRHIGRNQDLGWPKAQIVHSLAGFLDPQNASRGPAHTAPFVRPFDAELARSVAGAALIVDVSTTLYVGRDAMDDDMRARMASMFLTPSGLSSVLLLDSSDRAIRVGHLEAQYYRAILESDWGETHLDGAGGPLHVGGGCRDASVILSNELIHFHAGLLARQLRRSRLSTDARICVWTMNDTNGALEATEILVAEPLIEPSADWRIVWDEGVKARMFALRDEHLPSETGGILLGYTDCKSRTVFVVAALLAPPDSEADETGFTRGTVGVAESIECGEKRTGGIVSYLGEWHSHPTGHSAMPSVPDFLLLDHFFNLRAKEGLPTVMIIAGHNNQVSVSLAAASETD